MADKVFRRDWAQKAAREKIRELKGKNMSYVAIGELTGVSGVYIGNIMKEENPKPVSKRVWDALVEKAGLSPVEPGTRPEAPRTEVVNPTNAPVYPPALVEWLIAKVDAADVAISNLSTTLKDESAERRKLQAEVDLLRSQLRARSA